jgi:hypothetical protein
MRVRTLAFTAFFTASVSLFAQENETIRYSNITEFGIITASPRSCGLEATTVHGFSLDKAHHFGLGFGIGGIFYTVKEISPYDGLSSSYTESAAYMPVFVNYRFYLKPSKSFSPHANISLGGAVPVEGYGFYSSITMGFKAGSFSFSSGISFAPLYLTRDVREQHYLVEDDYWETRYVPKKEWTYPIGITLKCGFTF